MSDVALSITLGIGLAAATGFRVFLPMLIVSAGAYTGHVPVGDSFAWLGTPSALTMLSVAAIVEILAYCIPGLDNMLDTLVSPAAFIAWRILYAWVMYSRPPMSKCTDAFITGGVIAVVTQVVTSTLSSNSTIWTGGLGNLSLSAAEFGGALLVSFLALAAPAAAIALVVLFLWIAIRLLRRLL